MFELSLEDMAREELWIQIVYKESQLIKCVVGYLPHHGGDPGSVIKAAYLEGRRSRVRPHSRHQVVKKQSVSTPAAHLWRFNVVGSLRDRDVACSATYRQGQNFESCVPRAVSSHHPQEDLMAHLSLFVHKGGIKPHSFHPIFLPHQCTLLDLHGCDLRWTVIAYIEISWRRTITLLTKCNILDLVNFVVFKFSWILSSNV